MPALCISLRIYPRKYLDEIYKDLAQLIWMSVNGVNIIQGSYRERMIKLMGTSGVSNRRAFEGLVSYGAHVKLSLIGQRVVAAPY